MQSEKRRKQSLRTLAGCVFLAVLLAVVPALNHSALHAAYAETAIPNDGFIRADVGSATLPKIVCLTFDDGPSKNTEPILEILEQYGVPATFFVTAQDVNTDYLPLVGQIAAAGHQVALHTASHQYSKIYASTDAFWLDIKELRQAIAPYIDVNTLSWLRFPGGSTNTISHKYGGSEIMTTLIEQAAEKGYRWIDWNICGEDATAGHPGADRIFRNVVRDAEGHDTCVVLLHDAKACGATVKALPRIIEHFEAGNYTFCTVARMDDLQSTP